MRQDQIALMRRDASDHLPYTSRTRIAASAEHQDSAS